MALKRGPEDLICSARGCENPAAWAVIWSNPNLHFGREKNWLACEAHREYLEDYLAYRSFPVRTSALADFLAHPDVAEGKITGAVQEHRPQDSPR